MLRLVAAIALSMFARQSPAAATETRRCDPDRDIHEVIGPADAAMTVDLYLDPVHAEALPMWLELRRLVHDHEGDLNVRAHIVRSADKRDRRVRDPVRAWVLAAASHRRLLHALRVLARDGSERVYARLTDQDALPALARELDLELGVLESELARGCASAHLEKATDAFAHLRKVAGDATGITPIFVLDGETVIQDGSRLEHLRPELSSRKVRSPPAAPLPALKLQGVSPSMVRPAIESGIKLGGVGLPHRMLIFASSEADPSLHAHFASVLLFRTANPGVLSVQLVARGRSVAAQTLANRLCAARQLGRELDFARYLAESRAVLRSHSLSDGVLLRELDEVVARGCDPGDGDPPDPEDPSHRREGLRDGPWIDGTLRSGPDLDRLGKTLRLLEAAQRPLGPLLSPASREEP